MKTKSACRMLQSERHAAMEVSLPASRFTQRLPFHAPLPVRAIAWLYIALPILNTLWLVHTTGRGWLSIARYEFVGFLLLGLAPILGVGLLRLRLWAYRAFLFHCGVLVFYNMFLFTALGGAYYFASLFRALLFVAVLSYFLRREIAAPYISLIPRGFRDRRRYPIVTRIEVAGQRFLTRDLSLRGVFVEGLHGLQPGRPVTCQLEMPDREQIEAILIRETQEGSGLKFKSPNRRQRRSLREFLRTRFPSRFICSLPATVHCVGAETRGRLVNISADGCYVALEHAEIMPANVLISADRWQREGVVSWVNSTGQHGLPPGCGVEFTGKRGAAFRQCVKEIQKYAEQAR